MGSGPSTAVYLPGAGWYGEAGIPVAYAIAATHTTHLLDLPGMGRSPGTLRKPRSLADLAPWLAGYFDAAGITQADVIGHSMGGAIGLAFALECPDRVRSLTLLDIGYFKIPRFPTEMFGAMGYLVPVFSGLHRVFGDRVLGKPAPLASPLDPQHENVDVGSDAAAVMLALYRANLPEMLRRVQVPCLVLHATYASPRGQAQLARCLDRLRPPPNVKLVPMTGGHYGHLTDPHAMDMLRAFLDDPGAPT